MERAAICSHAPAHADDAAYIRLLDVGTVPYDTANGAVLMGVSVCRTLENGGSFDGVERSLMTGGGTVVKAEWTHAQADVGRGRAYWIWPDSFC